MTTDGDCAAAEYVVDSWLDQCGKAGACTADVNFTNVGERDNFDCKAKKFHKRLLKVKCRGQESRQRVVFRTS